MSPTSQRAPRVAVAYRATMLLGTVYSVQEN